ncbi:MAG: adenylyl-sulfate kinase [Chromatiaceae bacterium]|nr:adenylyl-sulfate kinase [Chromatiaceae bacterium]
MHDLLHVWFTVLSGSVKSTIANTLDHRLHGLGLHSAVLDGGHARHELNAGPGIQAAARPSAFARKAKISAEWALPVTGAHHQRIGAWSGQKAFLPVAPDAGIPAARGRKAKTGLAPGCQCDRLGDHAAILAHSLAQTSPAFMQSLHSWCLSACCLHAS